MDRPSTHKHNAQTLSALKFNHRDDSRMSEPRTSEGVAAAAVAAGGLAVVILDVVGAKGPIAERL